MISLWRYTKELTCVVSPAVWLLLVLWLTSATLSYLHLVVLSAEIGPKQNSNRRLQIKATGVRCIFSFFPLLTLEKLPSSVGYKTPPPHKLTVNFGAVFFFYMWNTQRESAKKEKECEWVWPLSQAQGSQWGVFNQTLPTRRPLLCEQWHKQRGIRLVVILLPVSPEIKSLYLRGRITTKSCRKENTLNMSLDYRTIKM